MKDLEHIFDTHSHYDDPKFSGRAEEILTSLFERGVSGIVHAATDPESARFGIKMSGKFENFYTSVGIHPENADGFTLGDVYALKELAAQSEKIRAVGEIGLDYHYEGYDRKKQTELFAAQVELANELGLPVIVHCRDAVGDCMDILRSLRPAGVMHCFSGSYETAKEVISLGMYLGFTGILTFKNSKKAQEVVKNMPLERLLFETDCPYMAPEPHRGEVCHSGMILHTAQRAAELRGMDYWETVAAAEDNARRMYRVG